MQRCGSLAEVRCRVPVEVEVEQVGDEGPDGRLQASDPFDERRAHEHLMGEVEARHPHRARRGEHDGRRLRVAPRIELCDRGDVAVDRAPPMSVIPAEAPANPGSARKASATLVSGPVATSQKAPPARRLEMKPTHRRCRQCARATAAPDHRGLTRRGPAAHSGQGRGAGGRAGVYGDVDAEHLRDHDALRVVSITDAFPLTVVMPTISACTAASKMAMASSWPGSQSIRMRGRGTKAEARGSDEIDGRLA